METELVHTSAMCPALSHKSKLKRPASKAEQASGSTGRKYGYKKEVNSRFREKYNLTYSADAQDNVEDVGSVAQSLPLKTLDQPPFETILKLTQKQAKKYLETHDSLLSDKAAPRFVCWFCGSNMVCAEDGMTARCNTRPCQKARVTCTSTAYTPLFAWTRGGSDPDYQLLLRSMYVLGCKLPNDAATHMIRREDDSYRMCYDTLTRVWMELRICLAWKDLVFLLNLSKMHGIKSKDVFKTT